MDTSLVLDKSNKDWMAAMTATGVRHYIYPVHLSQVPASTTRRRVNHCYGARACMQRAGGSGGAGGSRD